MAIILYEIRNQSSYFLRKFGPPLPPEFTGFTGLCGMLATEIK